MAHKIAEIKGMEAAIVAKLATVQITTVEQLLAQAGTAAERNALSKQLGVSSSQLTEWVNRADLMRLKGVGTEMANFVVGK